jgi:LytS/YehU family sensor histidine kinase
MRGHFKKRRKTIEYAGRRDAIILNSISKLEKVRFGHRLQTNVICDEAALQLQLPSIAFYSPLCRKMQLSLALRYHREVLIKVHAKKIDNNLRYSVENPFDPKRATAKGTGFGLPPIQRRLFLCLQGRIC